jgi:hypothetical protein
MKLWPRLMELVRDRPTDQIAFLDLEAFQSSIGRRDQCPFVLGCAKDRTERKRPPSPELRSAWRRWLCAAGGKTFLRQTRSRRRRQTKRRVVICGFAAKPSAVRNRRLCLVLPHSISTGEQVTATNERHERVASDQLGDKRRGQS